MSRYKPYPEYASSDIGWIKSLPSDWRSMQLRHIALVVNGATPESTNPSYWDGGIDWYTPADLNNEVATLLAAPSRRITESGLASCAARLTPPGSVVLSTRAPVGSVGITRGVSATNQGCRTLVPFSDLDPTFLAVSLVAARHELNQRSNGTTFKELSTDALKSVRVPVPPRKEQTEIIKALGWETTRIDALISRKTRFIELLKEKRESLITRAVTKGLDPNAKMKASGVEWLENIPSHWDIAQIKRLLDSMDYGLSETSDGDGETEFLTMGNIQEGCVVRTGTKYLRSVPAEYLLRQWDLLFNRTNSLDLVGKVGLLREDPITPVTFASYLVRFRCKSNVNPEYLNYYLGCEPLLEIARALAIPSVSQANLNPNRYGYLQAPLPPKTEQDAIAAYLSAHDARIKKLRNHTEKSIALLQERRSALITAAVTGQIDLRGAA